MDVPVITAEVADGAITPPHMAYVVDQLQRTFGPFVVGQRLARLTKRRESPMLTFARRTERAILSGLGAHRTGDLCGSTSNSRRVRR